MKCSCGFILVNCGKWLICHVTNSGDRWDFPKGQQDENETHLETAIRELKEETSIVLDNLDNIVDLGEHKYIEGKNLHMFLKEVGNIDVSKLSCESFVNEEFPEVDRFGFFTPNEAMQKFGKNMKIWVEKNVDSKYKVP